MHFTTITPGTTLYERELALRDEVLRRPLGLSLANDDLSAETRQWHFGLVDTAGKLVACVVIVPLTLGRAKLRQMAVCDSEQGKGLGRRLVEHVEREISTRGVVEVELHARDVAVGFYERLGYAAMGEPFTEVGIPHRLMIKQLN